MHQGSFLAQSETSMLSQLQNEFILSQERTLMEMRLRNDTLQRQLQELQRTYNLQLAQQAELQYQLKSTQEQLQYERDQCTSRKLSASKYKEKFAVAQTAVQQMEKVNANLQRQLHQYRAKYETARVSNEELAKDVAFRTHDIYQTHESIKEENRRLQTQLEHEKNSNTQLREQIEQLAERLRKAESKVAQSDTRQRQLRLANAAAYDEMQLNLDKILRKVDLLEEQNEQLRRQQHKLQAQASRYHEEMEDLTRRYNFIARKKAHESARQLHDKLSPKKKSPY